jgi:hypothetical protein
LSVCLLDYYIKAATFTQTSTTPFLRLGGLL